MSVSLHGKSYDGCKCCNSYFSTSKDTQKLRRKNRRTSKSKLKLQYQ